MKTKLLLSISIFCLIASVSIAQITIDSTDMPIIGDTAIMGVDTTAPAGLQVLGTGAQTWDLTSIQVDRFDSMIYVDPAATPYAADFPTSNIAIVAATNTYQTLDTNALITVGQAGMDPFGAGVVVSTVFDPSQVIVTLPSTNGTTFVDVHGADQIIDTQPLGLPVPNVDSIRLVRNASATSIFDAYGNVTTPAGTYASIRQLYTEQTIDSIFAYCSDPAGCNVFIATLPFGWGFVPSQVTQLIVGLDNPALDTTYKYRWWANGEGVPVAEVETDTVGGVAISAKYKMGINVVAMAAGSTDALCKDSCDGTASVVGFGGGTGVYAYLWDDPAAQTTATATGLCAGVHNARVIDGVDTSGMISVTVAEPAVLNIIIVADTIFPPDTVGVATSLVSGGTNPYAYSWNSTPPQTTASAVDLIPGSYTLTITDNNGCVMTASASLPLTIGEYLAESKIALYPNPVANELFIETDLEHSGSFVVYNIVGKQVVNVSIQDKLSTINTTELARGMYVFQLINGEGTVVQTGKFTVER